MPTNYHIYMKSLFSSTSLCNNLYTTSWRKEFYHHPISLTSYFVEQKHSHVVKNSELRSSSCKMIVQIFFFFQLGVAHSFDHVIPTVWFFKLISFDHLFLTRFHNFCFSLPTQLFGSFCISDFKMVSPFSMREAACDTMGSKARLATATTLSPLV